MMHIAVCAHYKLSSLKLYWLLFQLLFVLQIHFSCIPTLLCLWDRFMCGLMDRWSFIVHKGFCKGFGLGDGSWLLFSPHAWHVHCLLTVASSDKLHEWICHHRSNIVSWTVNYLMSNLAQYFVRQTVPDICYWGMKLCGFLYESLQF